MHMCAEYTYKCNPGSRFATTHPPLPAHGMVPKPAFCSIPQCFWVAVYILCLSNFPLAYLVFPCLIWPQILFVFFGLHVPILCCLMSTLFHLTLPIALLLVGDWMTAIPFPQRPPIPQRGGTGLSLFYLYPKHILLSLHYLVFTIWS